MQATKHRERTIPATLSRSPIAYLMPARQLMAVNRAAADGKTIYAARRRRRVMPPCDAVKLDLVTASIGSRLDEVEIDAHSMTHSIIH